MLYAPPYIVLNEINCLKWVPLHINCDYKYTDRLIDGETHTVITPNTWHLHHK